jgi:transcription initiation factor TFIIIB Brf1 subunit/transcription initiation factor TFIIB
MAMIMKLDRCAACGSSSVQKLANGQIACRACGKVLPEALSAAVQSKIDTAHFTGLYKTREGRELKRRYRNAELPTDYSAAGAFTR